MPRVFAFAVVLGVVCAGAALGVVACGSDDELTPPNSTIPDASNIRRDSALVDPGEGGEYLDGGAVSPPTCEKYCELVTTNCVGGAAQYSSTAECMAFCTHLPLEEESRGADEKSAPSVGCREYWAGTPAQTAPETYCLAAGPFGGNFCGDRCTAFCALTLSVCGEADAAPYTDAPTCATACAGFSYLDAGTDGGGEGPVDGGQAPMTGNSLNCRLTQLREAIQHPDQCANLRADSKACSDQ